MSWLRKLLARLSHPSTAPPPSAIVPESPEHQAILERADRVIKSYRDQDAVVLVKRKAR